MDRQRIKECTELSKDILKNFEFSELPASKIILKCLRLCSLLGDEDGILLFTYESSGYPTTAAGITADAWRISALAGRRYFEKPGTEKKECAMIQLIAEIEETIEAEKLRLSVAIDPDISLSSANPNQFLLSGQGNVWERNRIVKDIVSCQQWLQKITGNLYQYILQIYNKLMYGNIIEDIFTSARMGVDDVLSKICPKALEKFVSVYENMDSENPEDWANAVHSCRRILVDVADALYPPQDRPIVVNKKTIKVGPDQYINRLIQFISSKEGSKTYKDVVGSDLSSIGSRLDAINDAVCKGTHGTVSKEEASRYIIHTYLLLSDVITFQTAEEVHNRKE